MWRRSTSSSEQSRPDASRSARPAARARGRAASMRRPVATTIARSSTLRSSRMLPGHCAPSAAPHRFARDAAHQCAGHLGRELLEEVLDQQRDVLAAFAQRREDRSG